MELAVKALKTSEVDAHELTRIAVESAHPVARGKSREKTRDDIVQGMAKDCHEWIFAAYDRDRLAGWLALYEISSSLDALFTCWTEVFSCSGDRFLLGLDAPGRRAFFYESWRTEKPLIVEASLTLSHGDRLIGLCRVLPLYGPTDGCLAPIGIVPAYRRKGWAQALLRVSMSRLRALDYRTMSCFVSTDNVEAVSLYKRLGFNSEYKIASLFGEIAFGSGSGEP